MLTLLSLLLFSPFRCSTVQTLIDSAYQSDRNRFHTYPITISDSCKGILPSTCLCHPEVSDQLGGPGTLPVESVSCQNSRLTDTDVFLALQTLPNVQYVTFYGNNFVEFTDRILGSEKHKSLLYLNLSNNNLLYLNQDTFIGIPSLQSLDLSENALYFREITGDYTFLRPLRFLRRLLLRRAFRRPLVNASAQVTLLERGLRQSRLRDLQFLDLSDNEFDQFPASLVCSTPGLTHLILASNRLRTLHFDKRCPLELKALDLRWNRIRYFDYAFARAAQYFGPISVQVIDNPFDCSSASCESMHSISWFRSTNVIKDKETIRCQATERGLDLDDDYRADNFLLYAPLKSVIQCKEPHSQERDTSMDIFQETTENLELSTSTIQIAESDKIHLDKGLAIELLSANNETYANNSANALIPFRYMQENYQLLFQMFPENLIQSSIIFKLAKLFTFDIYNCILIVLMLRYCISCIIV